MILEDFSYNATQSRNFTFYKVVNVTVETFQLKCVIEKVLYFLVWLIEKCSIDDVIPIIY
jgi:hypothetical protein